ncbi:hypothetical protein [Actinomadura craniellae]|uniref:hypothetical protein n=1 Tax=Actinomadura craniellae TaxID=2231787 RepID=UPI0011BF783C|nr:hypothetical protein [Actinomadura craniellae]
MLTEGKNGPELGACGISGCHRRALAAAREALRRAPSGARALVHRVTLNPVRPAYVYGSLLSVATRDPDSPAHPW